MILLAVSSLWGGCKSDSVLFSEAMVATDYSGYLAVSNSGSGVIALFDTAGQFVKLIRDLNPSAETPYGLGFNSSGYLLAVVDGTDRVEEIDVLNDLVPRTLTNAGLTSTPVMGITQDASGNIYITEGNTNTIEKFSPAFARQGNPFIAAAVTTGGVTCTISGPRRLAYIGGDRIAVASATNNRLLIYDTNGNCIASVTAAPFGSNAPTAVAWDSYSNKIIVGFATNSSIVAVNPDGSGAAEVFRNLSVVTTPTDIVADGAGHLYVVNTGLDTVEKLAYSGGASAVRATSSPYINPSVYLRDPQGVAIVP